MIQYRQHNLTTVERAVTNARQAANLARRGRDELAAMITDPNRRPLPRKEWVALLERFDNADRDYRTAHNNYLRAVRALQAALS